MLHAAWTILGKDLRLRVRDRSVLLFALVVPLGLTVLFSLVFPDTEDLQLTAAVLDMDGSDVTDGFTGQALPELVDAGVVTLVEVEDVDEATSALEAGDLDAAWVLPEGFGQAVTSAQPARLRVLVNPDRPLLGEIARSIAEGYADRLDAVGLAVATTVVAGGGDLDDAEIARAAQVAADTPPPVTLQELQTENRQLSSISHLAAGMAAFFVFFTVSFGVAGMLEERQLQTLPRLLASPLTPGAVQLGKTLGALVLGLVSMTVLALASVLVLGADWGPPAGVAVLIVGIVVAATGVMALVGSFARTAEQAGNFQAIVAIVLGMLGGVFFPLPVDEGLLRVVTLLSPHAWFLRGLGDLVGSGQVRAVLPAAAALVVFGVAAAVPAVVRLRRVPTW
jgi:ABC-2 type transport system permease protein